MFGPCPIKKSSAKGCLVVCNSFLLRVHSFGPRVWYMMYLEALLAKIMAYVNPGGGKLGDSRL